jgi:hypothetical protein
VPRHGLSSAALNGLLARAVNGGGRVLLWAEVALEPGEMLSLRAALAAGDDAVALADVVLLCANAVYVKALGAVSACEC